MLRRRPRLPLPPPIRGSEYGGWAYYTVVERLGEIAGRVLEENELAAAGREGVEGLIEELPKGVIRSISDGGADVGDWAGYVAPHAGRTWLEVPWFFAETYFYRRIMEAVGYFEAGPGYLMDPFQVQKREGLRTAREGIGALAARLAEGREEVEWAAGAVPWFGAALWGNQADLSLWPAGGEGQPAHRPDEAAAHVLADDTERVVALLAGQGGGALRIDMIADNAGFELVSDLCLLDYLLARPGVTVRMHLKAHPTFVSDALPGDVEATLGFLREEGDEGTAALGERLEEARRDGRLQLTSHFYWTSPLAGWEMPDDLYEELRAAALVISKGDANYRRLLGDSHWSFMAPFADIVSYFPAPLLALRTLKAELAVGLGAKRPGELWREDARWLTSGRWGVMHFAPGV